MSARLTDFFLFGSTSRTSMSARLTDDFFLVGSACSLGGRLFTLAAMLVELRLVIEWDEG